MIIIYLVGVFINFVLMLNLVYRKRPEDFKEFGHTFNIVGAFLISLAYGYFYLYLRAKYYGIDV